MLAANDVIYLITNSFYAYILCKFMRAFFGQKGKNQIVEVGSFAAYYCVNSLIYIVFHDTAITVATNLVLYYLLACNYKAGIKLKITSVIFIYATLFSSETIALLFLQLMGMGHFSQFDTIEYLTAQILIEVIFYTIVLIFSNYKLRQRQYPIPLLHWIAIVAIPVGTLLPTFVITETVTPDKVVIMVISEIVILLINFFVFYLYDHITALYAELMEKRLLEQQNNAYQKQLEIITHSQQKFKLFRHDMRHHFGVLKELIRREEYAEALTYLDDIGQYLSNQQEQICTGNAAVDSIVNYMAGVAKQKGIAIQLDIQVPEKLQITAFDLNGILSNLLDNAIKVVDLLPDDEQKEVFLLMKYERKMLYIEVKNPCSAEAQKAAAQKGHGLGLKSVQMAADQYDGLLRITETPQLFQAEVLLYET